MIEFDKFNSITVGAITILAIAAWHIIGNLARNVCDWATKRFLHKLTHDDDLYVTASQCLERQANCKALVNVGASIHGLKEAMRILVLHSSIDPGDKERALQALDRRDHTR